LIRRWRLRGLRQSQNLFCKALPNSLQSSDEVSQKAYGVVIRFVRRQPGNRSLAVGDPFSDQSCFAKASWGGHECEFVTKLYTLIETFDEMRSGGRISAEVVEQIASCVAASQAYTHYKGKPLTQESSLVLGKEKLSPGEVKGFLGPCGLGRYFEQITLALSQGLRNWREGT